MLEFGGISFDGDVGLRRSGHSLFDSLSFQRRSYGLFENVICPLILATQYF